MSAIASSGLTIAAWELTKKYVWPKLKDKLQEKSSKEWYEILRNTWGDRSVRYSFLRDKGLVERGVSFKNDSPALRDLMSALRGVEMPLKAKASECSMLFVGSGDSACIWYSVAKSHTIRAFPKITKEKGLIGWDIELRNNGVKTAISVGTDKCSLMEELAPYLTTWMRNVNRKKHGEALYNRGLLGKIGGNVIDLLKISSPPEMQGDTRGLLASVLRPPLDWLGKRSSKDTVFRPLDLLLDAHGDTFRELIDAHAIQGKLDDFKSFLGEGLRAATKFPVQVFGDNCTTSVAFLPYKLGYAASLIQPRPSGNDEVFEAIDLNFDTVARDWVEFADKHSSLLKEGGIENEFGVNSRLFLSVGEDASDADKLLVRNNNLLWARNEAVALLPLDLDVQSHNSFREIIDAAASDVCADAYIDGSFLEVSAANPLEYFNAIMKSVENMMVEEDNLPDIHYLADNVLGEINAAFRKSFGIPEESLSLSPAF